mmetsp:Transcript_104804/g.306048  ORF Transcript_104804/g.306048 Transcript_104804/m.306048 type:complete len:376 (+) Transcript_104804:67-1194(+)
MALATELGSLSPAGLARSLRACCCSVRPASEATVHALVRESLSRGLQTFSPAGVCALADALSRRGLVHGPFVSAALDRMNRQAVARTPTVALHAWLNALVATNVPFPADRLDACLKAFADRGSHLSALVAASLLRSLLLADVTPSCGALRHGNVLAGTLLSGAAMRSMKCGRSGSTAGSSGAFIQSTLADVAWIVAERPPPWWHQPASHHAAILEAASAWHGELRPFRCQPSRVETSAHSALKRLGCSPLVGMTLGHFQIPLALPELRVAFLFPGPFGELRALPHAASSGGGTGPHSSPPAGAGDLRPTLRMRSAQLSSLGWHAAVLRDSEWPELLDGEGAASLHRREELLLRRKLANALQARVPLHRRRVIWPD